MADEKISILVVEDEAGIRTGLCDVLAFHGYAPTGVDRGDRGLQEALEGQYALVLLDVMLPGMDGFEVCRSIRAAKPSQGVLMLTAKGSEQDILKGFSAGCDDYVCKPFSLGELLARVEALLRRSGQLSAQSQKPFSIGQWSIDPENLLASCDGKTLPISRRESDLLSVFFSDSGRLISRRRLLKEVWGFSNPESVETRTVDVHIAKLRKKLDLASVIHTVRGEGYRYGHPILT